MISVYLSTASSPSRAHSAIPGLRTAMVWDGAVSDGAAGLNEAGGATATARASLGYEGSWRMRTVSMAIEIESRVWNTFYMRQWSIFFKGHSVGPTPR